MRRLRTSLICLVLATPPLHAAEDQPGLSSWAGVVRQRVYRVLMSTRGGEAGSVKLGFTVSSAGVLSGLHAEGPPRLAQQAMAALRTLGEVPPPPDHLSHAMSVRLDVK